MFDKSLGLSSGSYSRLSIHRVVKQTQTFIKHPSVTET
jgi:hypothetical protein